MSHTEELRQEWRQLRLLSRDSVRRLLDSVVIARDADPIPFALWALALVMTPPLISAIGKASGYAFLIRAEPALVERIVVADRLYFVVYGMLATALLASLAWDALFPDRDDQEIMGVLPVRPRTLAAARFGAAAALGLGFAAAINLLPALLYTAASAVHPSVGPFPRVLVAHAVATTMGCAFVFFGLMSLRAIVALCAGERIAERLAIVLQIVTTVALVEVFLFLPGVLSSFVRQVQTGDFTASLALPPIWFAALFALIAEGDGLLAAYAGHAVIATAAAGALALALSVLPAGAMGRRALETRAREHAGGLVSLARFVAALSVRDAAVRGLFLFTVASLARNRRHALVIASSIGLAIATCGLSLLSAAFHGALRFTEPRYYLLALPLVFMFFAVFGMRATFAIPADLEANWPFRLRQPSMRASISASRLTIVVFGVLPIAAAWLLVTLVAWPAAVAVASTVMSLASGVMLAEIALTTWTKVPFASAHEPATQILKSRWPWFVLALNLFGYRLADWQARALVSDSGVIHYVVAMGAVVVGIRVWRSGRLRTQIPTLDAVDEDRFETLNLSEALN
jgi:hypothetical protein